MYHYCSPVPRVIAERRVRALRRCSGDRGRTGNKKMTVFMQTSTPGVCSGQLPCVLQH